MPLAWSAFWTLFTCSALAPPAMLVPACGVPVLPPLADGMLLPVLGAVVPDCPIPAPALPSRRA